MRIKAIAGGILAAALGTAAAAEISVPMFLAEAQGAGRAIGQVVIAETPYGLVFVPQLTGLPPGLHGFHVHENPSCDAKDKDGTPVPALAAGGSVFSSKWKIQISEFDQ